MKNKFIIFSLLCLSYIVVSGWEISRGADKTGSEKVVPAKADAAKIEAHKQYKKLLIVGNSLTCHGPSTEELGWNGSWGMAATAENKDYVHVFYKLLSDSQKNQKIALRVDSMLATNMKLKASMLDFAPDLVVIQIGDNMADPTATMAKYTEPYEKMLIQLNKKSKPTILCISDWDVCPNKQAQLKKLCNKYDNVFFVDISKIGQKKENRALSEGVYTNPALGWHPGDRGMKKIAEELFKTLQNASAPDYSDTPK